MVSHAHQDLFCSVLGYNKVTGIKHKLPFSLTPDGAAVSGTHPLTAGPGHFLPTEDPHPCCLSHLLMRLSLSPSAFSSNWLVFQLVSCVSPSSVQGLAAFCSLKVLASHRLHASPLGFSLWSHSIWWLCGISFIICSWFSTSQASWIHARMVFRSSCTKAFPTKVVFWPSL